ncbi:hypothetical protein MVES_003090 [Malassezia vespertilionis]|uniref:Carboxypeptidase n=1 Tax=Malassezia vespertilionis TaxID=2020962 RepID=A0A2N1J9D3_9BASI|nr:hypothetical protein MVES_003090 [Malassezia vespertilionis]
MLPFLVDKHLSGIPFVLPHSWAGTLPVSDAKNDSQKLFFWLWEPAGDQGHDDVVVWLNGGPGCSSLEGLLQENGPISVGGEADAVTVKPNPYSWTNLSHVVWIESPVGVGFTEGTPSIDSERGQAKQMYGFLQQFFATFTELQGKRLWLTGESYAGKYIPYIADEIYRHDQNASGINLQGIAINDPSFTTDFLGEEAPVYQFIKHHRDVMQLNDTALKLVHNVAKKQGVATYVEDNLHYPPKGNIYKPAQWNSSLSVFDAASRVASKTKCFNLYNIKPDCGSVTDALGMPLDTQVASKHNFLNAHPDLKKALHVNVSKAWLECTDSSVFLGKHGDTSAPPDRTVLPGVIEKNVRTVIQHGTYDMVLIANGSALAIQNMTWNGKMGFQTKPSTPLKVDGKTAGVFAKERGLTFVQVAQSGHMIPQFKPEAAFKLQQYLLGQVSEKELQE